MTTTADDDPYLWLEDVDGERALNWVRAQNDRTLTELERHPLYAAWLDEAREILNSRDRIPSVALRGDYAYNFWQDETHVRGLWRRQPIRDFVAGRAEWDVLLDVDALAKEEGENWVFAGATSRAPDHGRAIIALSRGGADAAVRREFDLERRVFVGDGFILPEAKGGVSWVGPDTLLVATDLGPETVTDSGYPRQVRLWERGTDIAAAAVVFAGQKSDVGSFPFSSWTGDDYVAGVVRARTFYESDHILFDDEGAPVRQPLPAKAELADYVAGALILTLNEDWDHEGETFASGSLVAFAPTTGQAVLIYAPGPRTAVASVAASAEQLIVSLLDNIDGRLLTFAHDGEGWTEGEIALPANGVVGVMSVERDSGELLLTYENPATPLTLFHVHEARPPAAIRVQPAFFAADDVVSERRHAISSDGTEIPYLVIGRRDVIAAGNAPTIQYGYGGFGVPILPHYSGTTGKMWIERGGVWVIANIRGGGEFGPAWHQAGLKTARQLIYDDFFAVSEDVISSNLTSAAHLGILGGSNGGLLTGVALTQRPDLYAAAGIGVPLLDMLRFDRLLAGASWVGEYGSPEIAEERAFLLSISPYHQLARDGRYPRPYFFTSTRDDRVHPGHARKMAARMEEYGHPFLYYENIEGGHGAAANQEQQARRLALQFAYFADALGLGEN